MSSDIPKNLSGFPMVLSVSERTINDQLAKVHAESAGAAQKFPNTPWNMDDGSGTWNLTVSAFEAPRIDFDAPDDYCRLKLKIIDGSISVWTVKVVNGKHLPVSSDTDLSGHEIVVSTVVSQISHPHPTEENFTVQSLFVDLEGAKVHDIITPDGVEVTIAGIQKNLVMDLVKTRFDQIVATEKAAAKKEGREVEPPLLFGKVAIKQTGTITGALSPSALTYSTTAVRNGKKYVGGTINYLLSTDDHPQPSGSLVGLFNSSLLRAGNLATYVLSDTIVLETLAKLPLLIAYPDMKLTVDAGTYGVAGAKMHMDGDTSFGMTINDRGRSARFVKYEAVVEGSNIKFSFKIKTSEYGAFNDIDVEVTGHRMMTVKMVGNKLKAHMGDFVMDHYWEESGSPFGDLGDWKNIGFWDSSDNMLDDVLNSLNVPGSSVLKFNSATLDGQLFIDVSYA